MPPMNCERAVRGLMIRPAAKTPSSRGTRISPVSALHPRLGELRAEGVHGVAGRRSGSAGRRRRRPRRRRRRSPPNLLAEGAGGLDDRRAPGAGARRAAGHRGDRVGGVADAHVDVVDRRRRGRRRRSAAARSRCRCRCRRRRSRRRSGRPRSGCVAVDCGLARGRVDRARRRRCRPASRRRGARPAAGRGRPSRTARAPSRRHSTRCRLDHGLPGLGVDLGLVADPQLDRVDARAPRRARPSRPRARTCPGTRRGRASRTGTGTSRAASRCVVRRFGAAYIDPGRDAGLLGELLDPRGLLDDVDRDRRAGARRGRRRAASAGSSACGSRRGRTSAGG